MVSPGAGVTGCGEWLDIGTGKLSQVLWKYELLTTEPAVQPLCVGLDKS